MVLLLRSELFLVRDRGLHGVELLLLLAFLILGAGVEAGDADIFKPAILLIRN
jgi:hypothetical protein